MKTYWLIPGFALLLLGAGCALSKSQTNQAAAEIIPVDTLNPSPLNEVHPVPAATVTSVSEEPASVGGEVPATPHVVTMNGGEYFFDPASISAKAGETLTINFGSVTGHHIFTIDELSISKEMTPGGSVTFTVPSTPGRYTYYCSVEPHRTLGMTGTLIVE